MIIPAGQTNAGWYWYHYDGLGSVVALSDSSGSIVEAYPDLLGNVFGAVKVHTAAGTDGIWLTSDDAPDVSGYYIPRKNVRLVGRYGCCGVHKEGEDGYKNAKYPCEIPDKWYKMRHWADMI